MNYFFRNKKIGMINNRLQFVAEKTYLNIHRLTGGIALSVAVLHDLKRKGVKEIIFLYRNSGETSKFVAAPNDFFERGIRLFDNKLDTQISLPLHEFNQPTLNNFIEEKNGNHTRGVS